MCWNGALGTQRELIRSNRKNNSPATSESTPCAWAPVAPPYLRHWRDVSHQHITFRQNRINDLWELRVQDIQKYFLYFLAFISMKKDVPIIGYQMVLLYVQKWPVISLWGFHYPRWQYSTWTLYRTNPLDSLICYGN